MLRRNLHLLLGWRDRTAVQQWTILLVLSGAFVLILEAMHLPAALLLGPTAAAIFVAGTGADIRIASGPFVAAQAIIGCMMARSIPLSIAGEMLRDWPLLLAGVVSVIAASATIGWMLARWHVLPGTTAIWGSSPGAASAMTVMAEAYGADIRLVAFMQYLRVVCVAAVASIVTRVWLGVSGGAPPAIVWFPAVAWVSLLETLALAGLGAFVARQLRVPAGGLLLPLAGGMALQGTGLMTIELPPWLLAISYAVVGWSIGLRFDRPILAHVARASPRVLASTLALIALCGLFALGLVAAADVDPLTAFLAMSPGGADAVAIIAASSHVNQPFVMAMQTARLLVVLVTGPSLARFLAGRVVALQQSADRAT